MSLSLNPDLLRATGVCLYVDFLASVCIDNVVRGERIIQPHRLDLGIDRESVSNGQLPTSRSRNRGDIVDSCNLYRDGDLIGADLQMVNRKFFPGTGEVWHDRQTFFGSIRLD